MEAAARQRERKQNVTAVERRLTGVKMKLNISFPVTGYQKLIEVDDDLKFHTSYEKHMATDVAADVLGEEWKGYVVRISGGNDK
ncbi:hypothetical protein STEG23_031929 [Scotinomys teguina]